MVCDLPFWGKNTSFTGKPSVEEDSIKCTAEINQRQDLNANKSSLWKGEDSILGGGEGVSLILIVSFLWRGWPQPSSPGWGGSAGDWVFLMQHYVAQNTHVLEEGLANSPAHSDYPYWHCILHIVIAHVFQDCTKIFNWSQNLETNTVPLTWKKNLSSPSL